MLANRAEFATADRQPARSVEFAAFGAVLPGMAAVEFAPHEGFQFPLSFLKSYARPICVAWNPRLADVRPVVEQAVKALQQVLAGEGGCLTDLRSGVEAV